MEENRAPPFQILLICPTLFRFSVRQTLNGLQLQTGGDRHRSATAIGSLSSSPFGSYGFVCQGGICLRHIVINEKDYETASLSIKCGGHRISETPMSPVFQLDGRPTGKARLTVSPTAS